ncbi:MAG TPA: phosphoribosylanthranilate isomerase [Candidatus Sulfotelmatobacter sp.]
MTWVKICGMTNLEDALVAVDAGADAVGFIFYEKSPRNIKAEAARAIVEELPEEIEKVAVFVGGPAERVNELAAQAGMTMVQYYATDRKLTSGDWLDISQQEGRRLVIAVSSADFDNGGVIGSEAKKNVYAMLIDSGSAQRRGGTGVAFNWECYRGRVRALNTAIPVIIAGGLDPENVGQAIEILKPWGVDVASGVEVSPGRKDPAKVRAFVNAVRAVEKSA